MAIPRRNLTTTTIPIFSNPRAREIVTARTAVHRLAAGAAVPPELLAALGLDATADLAAALAAIEALKSPAAVDPAEAEAVAKLTAAEVAACDARGIAPSHFLKVKASLRRTS